MLICTCDHLGIILWSAASVDRVLRTSAERLNKYSFFKVGLDTEAFSYDFLRDEHPDTYQRLMQLFSADGGRYFNAACTYGQPLSCFISPESNIRQISYAVDASARHFGQKLSTYISSEHTFHAQLPQILLGCGFTGAVLRDHFLMYGAVPQINRPSVLWEGADGSAIKALPSYVGENAPAIPAPHTPLCSDAPFGDGMIDNQILFGEGGENFPTLSAFREKFSVVIDGPLAATHADDPRQPESVLQWCAENPGYQDFCTCDELLDRLPDTDFRFSPGNEDFPVRLPWGFMGGDMMRKVSGSEKQLAALERLVALSAIDDGARETCERLFQDCWQKLLVLQHHDIQIVGCLHDSARMCRAYDAAFGRLIDQLSLLLPRDGVSHRFNPSMRELSGIAPFGSTEAVPAATEIPEPMCGEYKTKRFTVTPHPQGGFSQILADGKKLFAGRSGYLRGVIDGKDCQSTGRIEAFRLNGGALRLVEKGQIAEMAYTIRWHFNDACPEITFDMELCADGRMIGRKSGDIHDPFSAYIHEEKLRMILLPALREERTGIYDRPFACERTVERYVQGYYLAAVTDGSDGIAVYSEGGVCLAREDEGVCSIPLAFAMHHIWDDAQGTINASMISQDNSGVHLMQGRYSYRYAIRAFADGMRDHQLLHEAVDFAQPVFETRYSPALTALTIDAPGCELSALFTDKGRLFVRLYDVGGEGCVAKIHLGGRPARLRCCTMLCEESGDWSTSVSIPPKKIMTLRVG